MPEATRPFQRLQYGFAASIRDPENQPRPQGVPAPRMQVYQELIYNNLESFLATGFPVLKATAGDAMWRALIRDFLRCHQSKTPYLAELGEEFLTYLQNERTQIESDPAFLLELAHYECSHRTINPTGIIPKGPISICWRQPAAPVEAGFRHVQSAGPRPNGLLADRLRTGARRSCGP